MSTSACSCPLPKTPRPGEVSCPFPTHTARLSPAELFGSLKPTPITTKTSQFSCGAAEVAPSQPRSPTFGHREGGKEGGRHRPADRPGSAAPPGPAHGHRPLRSAHTYLRPLRAAGSTPRSAASRQRGAPASAPGHRRHTARGMERLRARLLAVRLSLSGRKRGSCGVMPLEVLSAWGKKGDTKCLSWTISEY